MERGRQSGDVGKGNDRTDSQGQGLCFPKALTFSFLTLQKSCMGRKRILLLFFFFLM